MDDPKSKRRNPRRKIRVPILSWETEAQKLSGRGKEVTSRDISADGIGFYAETIFPIGTTLHFDIYIPGKEKPISTEIEVT